ncbi:uncharacterized protein LOC123294464 [Chrysoperla carnea]|nr:uncharacterized protein LOC123294464 [Chrysoperla carnea]
MSEYLTSTKERIIYNMSCKTNKKSLNELQRKSYEITILKDKCTHLHNPLKVNLQLHRYKLGQKKDNYSKATYLENLGKTTTEYRAYTSKQTTPAVDECPGMINKSFK